ncbi:hypothetical protein N658DRAFT_432996 [Parathielavia hyrcaniae]|uniref:DUF3752 domain-containing protein n=1 Tax=Parathielavia hyrcaniae TaxID=113614 RepID=A0AAN6PUC8_9PEZI|nr:hypothetical protein N658DRAFT_432996 [Parathielavia hyrcaniae]
MASIGPQLPPHLQKRKREDDRELGSPPPKTSRRDNEDEIPLGDDSDDGFGPSAPVPANNREKRPAPTVGPSMPLSVANTSAVVSTDKQRSIGPSLPSAIAQANNDEIALDSDADDDTTGPAPPPKRVLGPAPPPALLSERPPSGPDPDPASSDNDDDDDDDDDDWGPALPSTSTNSKPHGPTLPRTSTSRPEPPAAPPKRDDWMLAPPTSSGPRAPDPTKLKSRKFASGPRAATEAKPAGGGGVSSIWTETPEEKARRLANAVLGRADPNNPSLSAVQSSAAGGGGTSQRRQDDGGSREDEARIRSYVEQTRGRSLMEEHQAAKKRGTGQGGDGGGDDDEVDDPSKRAFDWEKDMKVGGRISNAQRKELLNRAANFGGRFQSGKYL